MKPDLSRLDAVVASRVVGAVRATSARLAALGIRHALVGDLAVAAYGRPRGVRVEFLVGPEAFEQDGEVVTMRPGVPIAVAGVAVDVARPAADEGFLVAALGRGGDVPIAPIEAVVYLKLCSPLHKDLSDVVGLIDAGLELETTRAYLFAHAPRLVARWDDAVELARAEEELA